MKKSKFKSLLLSILCPGLGQLRNGQNKKSAILIVINLILLFLGGNVLAANFKLLFATLVIVVIFQVYIFSDSWRNAPATPIADGKYQKVWLYIVIILLWATVPGITKATNRYKSYNSPSESMSPTLIGGDYFMVDRHAFKERGPINGELVVYHSQTTSAIYIKRVMAGPGDTIATQGKTILINGKTLNKGSLSGDPEVIAELKAHSDPGVPTFYQETNGQINYGIMEYPTQSLAADTSMTLKDGEYFVVGDNRDNSKDSRFTGPISKSDLRGKPIYIYYSRSLSEAHQTRFSRIGKDLH